MTVATEAPHALKGSVAAPAPRPRSSWWWAALAILMLIAAAAVLRAGRGTSFWYDEWDWIQQRRAWSLDALLRPHNQHLSLVPVLVFKLGFATVGLKSYLPYRLVLLALHLTCAGLLFAYARVRTGAGLALALATILLFLGPAWMDILWAFQIGYLASLAAGLGALLALDRRSDRGDVLAGVLLGVSLASSSLGIPIWLMAAFDVLARPGHWRRWPVVALPLALYVLWYAVYGTGGDLTVANAFAAPGFVADMASGAAGALAGLSPDWGRPLALAIAALVAWRALAEAQRPWRLAALALLPLAFWALTALARAQLHEPNAPRYLYPGALFLLLLLAEAARGIVLSRRAAVLLALVVAAVTLSNEGALRNGGGYLRDEASKVRGSLAALGLVRGALPSTFAPAGADAPQITVAGYRAAVRDLGAPDLPSNLAQDDAQARAAADAALLRAGEGQLAPAPSTPTGAPVVEGAQGVATQSDGTCVLASRASPPARVEVRVPPVGLAISADPGGSAKLAVRRWGDAFSRSLTTVVAGAPQVLRFAADAASAPWHAQLAVTGTVHLCAS